MSTIAKAAFQRRFEDALGPELPVGLIARHPHKRSFEYAGTHTRLQLVANDGTGASTLTDMGARFAIATGGVLTLYIAAPPNGGSV